MGTAHRKPAPGLPSREAPSGQSPSPACQRCGLCCRAHIALLAHPADLERWRRERRWDILRVVEAETCDTNGMGDTALMGACPFLVPENGHWSCAIYPTRPLVCREFQPGSALCSLSRTAESR